MRTGHLVSSSKYIFGAVADFRDNTTDNGLVAHFTVKRSIRKVNFVLLPVGPTKSSITTRNIQLRGRAAKDADLRHKYYLISMNKAWSSRTKAHLQRDLLMIISLSPYCATSANSHPDGRNFARTYQVESRMQNREAIYIILCCFPL
jgi:hypothetical protein